MKDFPAKVDGPMGPWFRKVNEVVAKAQTLKKASDLRGLLGEPDAVHAVETDDRVPDGEVRVSPRYPAEYWEFIDPYRPRRRYWFGINKGRVIESQGRMYAGCHVCGEVLFGVTACPRCGTPVKTS